jgi:predicted MFS family arabinose efflux permease
MEALVAQQHLIRLLFGACVILASALALLPISGLPAHRALALVSALAFACVAIVLVWRARRAKVPDPNLYAVTALSAAIFAVAVTTGPVIAAPATGNDISDLTCLIAGLVGVISGAAITVRSWINS